MVWKQLERKKYIHKSEKWMIDAWSGCSLHTNKKGLWEFVKNFSDVDQAKLWVRKNGKTK